VPSFPGGVGPVLPSAWLQPAKTAQAAPS
jgi:hypothetical protein